MKLFNILVTYVRFWWMMSIKVKSTKDETKIAAYYKLADQLEEKMYKLVG